MSFDPFIKREVGGITVYSHRGWLNDGIDHGFIGVSGGFGEVESSQRIFEEIFGVKIILPKQFHSDTIIEYPLITDCQGDAVMIDSKEKNIAIGVRTADCLPILIRSKYKFAAVHSGWRGLANRIFQKTYDKMFYGESLEVLVGPAAGPYDYEVGKEVIDQIGSIAEFQNHRGKIYLNMDQTLRNMVSAATISTLDISTVVDTCFYSYRRDSSSTGRNLAFIKL